MKTSSLSRTPSFTGVTFDENAMPRQSTPLRDAPRREQTIDNNAGRQEARQDVHGLSTMPDRDRASSTSVDRSLSHKLKGQLQFVCSTLKLPMIPSYRAGFVRAVQAWDRADRIQDALPNGHARQAPLLKGALALSLSARKAIETGRALSEAEQALVCSLDSARDFVNAFAQRSGFDRRDGGSTKKWLLRMSAEAFDGLEQVLRTQALRPAADTATDAGGASRPTWPIRSRAQPSAVARVRSAWAMQQLQTSVHQLAQAVRALDEAMGHHPVKYIENGFAAIREPHAPTTPNDVDATGRDVAASIWEKRKHGFGSKLPDDAILLKSLRDLVRTTNLHLDAGRALQPEHITLIESTEHYDRLLGALSICVDPAPRNAGSCKKRLLDETQDAFDKLRTRLRDNHYALRRAVDDHPLNIALSKAIHRRPQAGLPTVSAEAIMRAMPQLRLDLARTRHLELRKAYTYRCVDLAVGKRLDALIKADLHKIDQASNDIGKNAMYDDITPNALRDWGHLDVPQYLDRRSRHADEHTLLIGARRRAFMDVRQGEFLSMVFQLATAQAEHERFIRPAQPSSPQPQPRRIDAFSFERFSQLSPAQARHDYLHRCWNRNKTAVLDVERALCAAAPEPKPPLGSRPAEHAGMSQNSPSVAPRTKFLPVDASAAAPPGGAGMTPLAPTRNVIEAFPTSAVPT